MKLINRKNYIPVVCIVYTLISLGKIALETIEGHNDPNYVGNFITIFVLSLAATFVLSLQYYLQKFPLTIVIVGQYFLLIGIIMLGVLIGGHFQKLASTAYRDMFWSFTIPYIIGAGIYYTRFLLQVRKANMTLKEFKKSGGKTVEH